MLLQYLKDNTTNPLVSVVKLVGDIVPYFDHTIVTSPPSLSSPHFPATKAHEIRSAPASAGGSHTPSRKHTPTRVRTVTKHHTFLVNTNRGLPVKTSPAP